MNIKYVEATKESIDEIFEINKALIDKYEDISKIDYSYVLSWVKEKVTNYIQEYKTILYASKKAGYVRIIDEGERIEIDDLFVNEEFQNKGIGTYTLLKIIKENKQKPICLYVFIKNVGAVRLYKRLGFKVKSIIKETRYLMEYK